MSIDKYNSALARLQNRPILERTELSKKVGSCSALFFEYLRRAAVLCDVLEDTSPYAFGDFLSVFSPQIGPDISIDRAVESIPPDKDRAWGFRLRLMTNLLRWEKYSDESESDQILNLYEPLLMFFDRGGSFYREKGLVYIDDSGFNVGTAQKMVNYPPLKSLEKEFLDQIDAQWVY